MKISWNKNQSYVDSFMYSFTTNYMKETFTMENTIHQNTLHRGAVFYANLESDGTSRQSGLRPVVLVSNNLANRHSPVVVIVSLSSQIYKRKDCRSTVCWKHPKQASNVIAWHYANSPFPSERANCSTTYVVWMRRVCLALMIAWEYSCAFEPLPPFHTFACVESSNENTGKD